MGAHSCDLYAEPTDSDNDSPDDKAGADAGAATVNLTAANATDDCEVCLVVQREPRLALVPCGHQRFCESCVRHLESIGSRCLSCRADITMVLRLFDIWDFGFSCLHNIVVAYNIIFDCVSTVYCTSILIYFAFHIRWSRFFYLWKFDPAFSSPAFSASPAWCRIMCRFRAIGRNRNRK